MECTGGQLTASFSRARDPYLGMKHLSVALDFTGACNVRKSNDTQYISISVPFDECGTQLTVCDYRIDIIFIPEKIELIWTDHSF